MPMPDNRITEDDVRRIVREETKLIADTLAQVINYGLGSYQQHADTKASFMAKYGQAQEATVGPFHTGSGTIVV